MTDSEIRFTRRDPATGEIHETAISAAQALDLAGDPACFSYFVGPSELLVDEDGEITHRDSAIPNYTNEPEDDPR